MQEKIGKLGYNGLIIMLACGLTALKHWGFDNDAWFILNCGRYVVETGTIPHEEFATIHEGLHYVMGQWLTAVIFWKVYSNFGADGLLFLVWLAGFILIFIYFKLLVYVSDGNKKISALFSFWVNFCVMMFINTRPQIFSTLILLIEVFLLEKYFRERKIWTLCIVPILSALLINFHAAIFPMTIIVVLPYLAESLILKIKKTPAPIKQLSLTIIGIFFAGFLNPYGWESITYFFTSMAPEVYILSNEIKPPFNLEPPATIIHLTMLFMLSFLIVILNLKKFFPPRYFFLSFGLMILSFISFRCLFLFLILGTFPIVHSLKNWRPFGRALIFPSKLIVVVSILCGLEIYSTYNLAESSNLEATPPMKIIFLMLIIFLLCYAFFYQNNREFSTIRFKSPIIFSFLQVIIFFANIFFSTPRISDEPYKPALDFLLSKNRAEDIILWCDVFGGSYAEFRGVKCYIDVRNEVFVPSHNHKKNIDKEYLELLAGRLDYRKFFERYNFTHIFINDDPEYEYLYSALSHDDNYRLIFEYDLPDCELHGRIFVPVKKDD